MNAGRRSVWCCEPAPNLTRMPRGTTECRSRQGSTHSKVCEQRGSPLGHLHRGPANGRRKRALLWAGRPQTDGGGLRHRSRPRPVATPRGPHFRHHDRRLAGAGRLAERLPGHACGDGVHRRVLEADLESTRGPVRATARECASRQAGTRSQNGCERLRMVGRSSPPRPAQSQLRATSATTRAARI